MKSNPLISIITPNYNMGEYLEETIKSVINQKGSFKIQYILMDGQSTDNSLGIIKKYAALLKNNSRIDFIWKSEKDKGQSDAINKGMKLATGEVLAYINSDDIYETGAFKEVLNFFNKYLNIDFLYGKCAIINETGKEKRKIIKLIKIILGYFYSFRVLLIINFIPQPATFWRKKVYSKVGKFNINNHLCMDYEYWCKFGKLFKGKFINKNLAKFRLYSESKSGSSYRKQFYEEFFVAKKFGKKYPFSIFMHFISYKLIIIIYNLMRFFKL